MIKGYDAWKTRSDRDEYDRLRCDEPQEPEEPEEPAMSHEELHAMLQETLDKLAALYGKLPPVPPDTVFAIGEATAHIAEAKALVGRDIDMLRGIDRLRGLDAQ